MDNTTERPMSAQEARDSAANEARDRNATIAEVLAIRLGRAPTHSECVGEVMRILADH